MIRGEGARRGNGDTGLDSLFAAGDPMIDDGRDGDRDERLKPTAGAGATRLLAVLLGSFDGVSLTGDLRLLVAEDGGRVIDRGTSIGGGFSSLGKLGRTRSAKS